MIMVQARDVNNRRLEIILMARITVGDQIVIHIEYLINLGTTIILKRKMVVLEVLVVAGVTV